MDLMELIPKQEQVELQPQFLLCTREYGGFLVKKYLLEERI